MLRNKSGRYLECTAAGVKAAAASRPTISPSDFSVVDAAGASAWPISGFSWGMVYEQPGDKARAKLVRDALLWLVTAAQPIAGSLNYVPLPPRIEAFSKSQLERMKV